MAKLKKGDDALLVALACGATVQSAAEKAGLSPRTAHRRLEDLDFRRRLDQLRGESLERASGMLGAAAPEAIKALLSLLQDASQPGNVRAVASKTMLEMGLKYPEVAQLAKRISALERQVDNGQEKV